MARRQQSQTWMKGSKYKQSWSTKNKTIGKQQKQNRQEEHAVKQECRVILYAVAIRKQRTK